MRRNGSNILKYKISFIVIMVMILSFFVSCASVSTESHPYSEEENEKAVEAIRLLMDRTSTAAPENMFVAKADLTQLDMYLPQTAQGIVGELDIIPGFRTECRKWLDIVHSICASISLTIPEVLDEAIATVWIAVPQAIVLGPTTSSTSLLDTACSDHLEAELQQTLRQRLADKTGDSQSADEIWGRIIIKYNIWRTAQMNLSHYSGRTVPQEVSGDVSEHLARLICDMFFTQMAIEEDAIRTTPRPQDDSIIAEVFAFPMQ